MSGVDNIEFHRLCGLRAARFEYGIPPSESDRRWFERHKKSSRIYHVRPSKKSDHPVFGVGAANPAEFLTIVWLQNSREWCTAVVSRSEHKFGPTVDCDEYAYLRLDALDAENNHKPKKTREDWLELLARIERGRGVAA